MGHSLNTNGSYLPQEKVSISQEGKNKKERIKDKLTNNQIINTQVWLFIAQNSQKKIKSSPLQKEAILLMLSLLNFKQVVI